MQHIIIYKSMVIIFIRAFAFTFALGNLKAISHKLSWFVGCISLWGARDNVL